MDLLFAPFEYLIFVIHNNYFPEPKKRENSPVYGSIGTTTDLIDRSYHANKIKMHASSDDPLHETNNAQAHQSMLESEHVEKICLGFVRFLNKCSNLKSENEVIENRKISVFRSFCVFAGWVLGAGLMPYAIKEIRDWCDFLFVSFDVCCQFLSQFFRVNGKMRLKSNRPYVKRERRKICCYHKYLIFVIQSSIRCHSCGSDTFSIWFRSNVSNFMFLFYLSYRENGNRE